MADCGKNFHWKWTTPHRIGLLNTWTRTFSLTNLAQVHWVRLWSCFSSFPQFGPFLPPVWAFHTTVFSNRISFIFVQLDFCHTCRDICFTFTFLLSSCMRLPSSRLGLPFLSFGPFFSHLWDISENESQLQKYNANNCCTVGYRNGWGGGLRVCLKFAQIVKFSTMEGPWRKISPLTPTAKKISDPPPLTHCVLKLATFDSFQAQTSDLPRSTPLGMLSILQVVNITFAERHFPPSEVTPTRKMLLLSLNLRWSLTITNQTWCIHLSQSQEPCDTSLSKSGTMQEYIWWEGFNPINSYHRTMCFYLQ